MLIGWGFLAWCVYMGVYVPSKYGSYGNVEADYARTRGYDRMEEEMRRRAESVGEDNVGESLDDDE
jgi:hypothetical protein